MLLLQTLVKVVSCMTNLQARKLVSPNLLSAVCVCTIIHQKLQHVLTFPRHQPTCMQYKRTMLSRANRPGEGMQLCIDGEMLTVTILLQ